MLKTAYRPDIDGLRAVAVLAVLFYHFDVPPFTGGFVGVDVFFAISGYLITKIIVSETEAGAFAYGNFYYRRSRRLLPALLVTIAGAYLAGFVFFSAEDFARSSGSAVASLLALSNIFFWSGTGYFDADALSKPLLHTWSLAVEFQFYLVWPAIILILHRLRGREFVLAGTLFVAILSFASSLYMMRKDPSGAFYLTPFRIYEFALGAIVVFLEDRKPRGQWFEAIYVGGLAAVLFGVFAFSDLTVFPGYAALVPSSGAAFMIYAGSSAKASWFLRTSPMRFIGTISYSLYLVHWPLLVFTRYVLVRELSALEVAGLLVVTFALGILLHRFVEAAFRKPNSRRLASPAAFSLACAGVTVLIMAPAASSWISGGWLWRMPAAVRDINNFDVKAMRRYVWSKHTSVKGDRFTTEKKRIFVIGDSQAGDFVNMLFEAGQNSNAEIVSSIIITECGIPFISAENEEAYWISQNVETMKQPNHIQTCKEQISSTMNSAALREADVVVVSMLWRSESLMHLDAAIAEIKKHTKASIYLTGRKDMAQSSIGFVNKYGKLEGIEAYASKFKRADNIKTNQYVRASMGRGYIDLMGLVCPRADFCHVLTENLKPIFYDRGHLTKDGAAFLGRKLLERRPDLFADKKNRPQKTTSY